MSDPQIDHHLKNRCQIAFDPADVPRQCLVTAGQAWLDCLAKKFDPDRFGHRDVTEWWFIKVNVVRDHYALNGRETSDCNGWRAGPPAREEADWVVGEHETAWLDDIAVHPERPIVGSRPDWQP